MKKIKLSDITAITPTLEKLAAKEFPFLTSLAISKLIKALEIERNLLHKTNIEMLKKHGAVDDDQGSIKLEAGPSSVAYGKEFEKFLATEVEVDFKPLKLAIFEKMQLTPADIIALEPFIEGAEKTEVPKELEKAKKK